MVLFLTNSHFYCLDLLIKDYFDFAGRLNIRATFNTLEEYIETNLQRILDKMKIFDINSEEYIS